MNRQQFLQENHLVDLTQNPNLLLQIIYATPNNFTGQKLYSEPFCYLRKQTYRKLVKAKQNFQQQGKKLIIWDAFRPLSVQKKMWNFFPNENFVANPKSNNAMHCKGSAVDVTLADLDGNLLKMPTEFDHFGPESFRENLEQCSTEVQNNVQLLTDVMCESGFKPIPTEWWHFNDTDSYPYINA